MEMPIDAGEDKVGRPHNDGIVDEIQPINPILVQIRDGVWMIPERYPSCSPGQVLTAPEDPRFLNQIHCFIVFDEEEKNAGDRPARATRQRHAAIPMLGPQIRDREPRRYRGDGQYSRAPSMRERFSEERAGACRPCWGIPASPMPMPGRVISSWGRSGEGAKRPVARLQSRRMIVDGFFPTPAVTRIERKDEATIGPVDEPIPEQAGLGIRHAPILSEV